MRPWRVCLVVTVSVALAAGGARAQQAGEWDPERVVATRPGLEALKGRLELAAQSTAYSPHLRAAAARQAQLIGRRLTDGDFRPGDRLLVQVPGEPSLTDTFNVGPARDIALPMIGSIPLQGVLRADVETFIKTYLGKYIRNPQVVARPLVPVSVLGRVGHPGFYTLPTSMAFTQVLNAAGGSAPDADLTQILVVRQGRVVWDGAALQRAIADGRTIQQLDLRPGDQITVGGGETDLFRVVQTVSYALGIPLAIYSVVQIFKGK